MTGTQIRETLKSKRIYQWEVAQKLKVSEITFCRWLREDDMSEEKSSKIMIAANEVLQERLASL